jgi:hypothetical protein
LEKAGVAGNTHEGFIGIEAGGDSDRFVSACRMLRHRERADIEQ